MKAFRFSLDRVRNYKSQILDKEKRSLGLLIGKRIEILSKIDEMEIYRLTLCHEAVANKEIGRASCRERV